MREDLLNILSQSNKDIDNQKLMDYISGKLSEEEKHDVEKWMIENPLFNEAMEGLQHAGDEHIVKSTVDQLNKQLRIYLRQKKRLREKRTLPVSTWTYVAVLFILALVVIVYLIINLKT
jgi:hypothetical protein